MAGVGAIRGALADSLRHLPGQVSKYVLTNPNPPAMWVLPGQITYHEAMQDGKQTVVMFVQLLTMGRDVPAQELLDRYMEDEGPHSVKAAIEADVSLGGVVSDVYVLRCSGYMQVERAGGAALVVEWEVHVLP